MLGIGVLLRHIYVSFVSIDPSDLDILQMRRKLRNYIIGSETQIHLQTYIRCAAYMWISVEIQFQQTFVILPKIVYNYSGSSILHLIKLNSHKKYSIKLNLKISTASVDYIKLKQHV